MVTMSKNEFFTLNKLTASVHLICLIGFLSSSTLVKAETIISNPSARNPTSEEMSSDGVFTRQWSYQISDPADSTIKTTDFISTTLPFLGRNERSEITISKDGVLSGINKISASGGGFLMQKQAVANAGSSDVKEYRQNFDFGPNTIHEIYLDNVKNDSSTLGSYKVSHGVSTVFLLDGYAFVNGTNYKIYQGNVFQEVGSEGSTIEKLSTGKNGLGYGIAFREGQGQFESKKDDQIKSQTINSVIKQIGDSDFRFNIGVQAQFDEAAAIGNKNIKAQQHVKEIGDIFATEAGIVISRGRGSFFTTQLIDKVNNIFINSDNQTVRELATIAGISTQSSSIGVVGTLSKDPDSMKETLDNWSSDNNFAQQVGISGKIEVKGSVKLQNPQYVFITSNGKKPLSFRAAIANLGGTQEITSLAQQVTLDVGEGTTKDFAVLVYPEFNRLQQLRFPPDGTTVTFDKISSLRSLPVVTTLNGNFDAVQGHVAVLGLMTGNYSDRYQNLKVALNLRANSGLGTFNFNDKGKLLVTNRAWDIDKGSMQSNSVNSRAIFSMGLGDSSLDNYTVHLPSEGNAVYVDGEFNGNGTFLLGSSWKNNQIIVNSTPIIIKTITKQGDGRASHLNLQVDVTSALDGAGKTSDIFNSNTSTVLHIMNQAVQNLIVGSVEEGALALGGLDVAEAMEVGAKMDTEKNLALKNPDLTQVSSSMRKAAGYVTLSYKEGLITPENTLFAKYYFDDKDGTGRDVSQEVAKAEDILKEVAQSLHSDAVTLADEDVDPTISASYTNSGVGSVVSDKELSQNFAAVDNPPGPENPDDPADPSNPANPANPSGPGENKPQKTTSTMDSIDSLGMANYFIWRQENETLYQRLGEVRDDSSARGLWVKVRGGRNKYSEAGNYFKNQYYGVQLGLDRPLDEEWTLGAAASYTYGDGKLTNGGKDDNWIASGSIYALGAFDDGSYLDVVLRASRIHNDFTVVSDQARYITKGKRSGNAYSASVEYGQKIPLNPNWYVDPQIQVTYGHIQGLRVLPGLVGNLTYPSKFVISPSPLPSPF